MADLEDFFKKKDKKKKGEKKFTTVNTDDLAENLDRMAVKEEMEMENLQPSGVEKSFLPLGWKPTMTTREHPAEVMCRQGNKMIGLWFDEMKDVEIHF